MALSRPLETTNLPSVVDATHSTSPSHDCCEPWVSPLQRGRTRAFFFPVSVSQLMTELSLDPE